MDGCQNFDLEIEADDNQFTGSSLYSYVSLHICGHIHTNLLSIVWRIVVSIKVY